jgi:hypothetical protein
MFVGVAKGVIKSWLRPLLGKDSPSSRIMAAELDGFARRHIVDGLADYRLDKLSRKYRFDVLFTGDINKDASVHDWLATAESSLMLVLGGKILKEPTLDAFRGGWVNGHGGILPDYRGLASEYWALKNGEPDKVGCTIHQLTKKIDRGRILETSPLAPNPAETLEELRIRNHANLVRTYLRMANQFATGERVASYDATSDSGRGGYFSYPPDYKASAELRVGEICPHL